MTEFPYLYCQRGEVFHVNARGEIKRTGRNSFGPSGQWTVRGAVRSNNLGRAVEFKPFPLCFTDPPTWKHKNGKGKWFIADRDHGTNRVQMTPVDWSGVSNVRDNK